MTRTAKFFVAFTALLMIAGCSCNKDEAAPTETTETEAPATGEVDAVGTPEGATAETMGAATPADANATETPAAE